ncbi:MAG: AAA family ATPase, partial [Gammaproteobacteria bacterium]|nr:AAA family ATPase [Gammaproteobacteria bacterium]
MTETLASINQLKEQMQLSVLGQEHVVDSLIIAMLANGNVLLEGLPGTAKTRSIKTMAKVLEADLGRIQFTADLLPSDVTGTEIFQELNGKQLLTFQHGPVFNNLVLADEINRAPAKVQGALLEAMEERQVTVAGNTHKLPELFMVLATQNPIEQEGTYPLPEAQMDRFLMKINIDYPEDETELQIIRLVRGEEQPQQGNEQVKIAQ